MYLCIILSVVILEITSVPDVGSSMVRGIVSREYNMS